MIFSKWIPFRIPFCIKVSIFQIGANLVNSCFLRSQLSFLIRIKNSITNLSAVLLISVIINVSLIKRPYAMFCQQISTEVQLKYIVTNKSVCSTFRVLDTTGSLEFTDLVCTHVYPKKLLPYLHKLPL